MLLIPPEKVCIVEGEDGGQQARKANAIIALIDVLHATTSIVTAIDNGCLRVLPVNTIQEAFNYRIRVPDVLLCGERDGVAPKGFDLGNSPLEYTREKVAGKELILTTTNCTRILNAIQMASAAPLNMPLYAVCLRNLGAAANLIRSTRASLPCSHVFIVAAGKENAVSMEDHTAARLLRDYLTQKEPEKPSTQRLVQILLESEHGRFLQEKGLGADLEFCAKLDTTTCVPYLRNGAFYPALCKLNPNLAETRSTNHD